MKHSNLPNVLLAAAAIALLAKGTAVAGPYSAASNDPTKSDAPVPGFLGPDGDGVVSAGNMVNPLFFGWITGVAAYAPAPGVAYGYDDTSYVLGPVTGDIYDVTALGDLNATQIAVATPPGSITLTFDRPITDRPGADFVVFENGFAAISGGGQIFADLAYVEISSNGTDFFRFPSVSNTPGAVGAYGTIDATNVHQLAGKHGNGYGISWGTPFDLSALAGLLDIENVTHVRIVDIPGDGSFADSVANPIYDAWLTFATGGFDLEAIGVISHLITFDRWQDDHGLVGAARGVNADDDGDGVGNGMEYALGMDPNVSSLKGLPSVSEEAGYLAISFVRDTRKTDLTYTVQSSQNLVDWDDIAVSVGGEPTSSDGLAVPASSIAEESASPLASVGVQQRVTVSDSQPMTIGVERFLRVTIEIAP